MANDAATLNAHLATALRDTDNEVWTSTERDNLIKWAVASLAPRVMRPIDPSSTFVTIVDATYYYSLPAGVRYVYRLDRITSDGVEAGPIPDGLWEQTGDSLGTGGKLHLSPYLVGLGGTLRVVGAGAYDTLTRLIPDEYVPLVLAIARAEAYRRMGADRVQFKQWLAKNQKQDVSVNELLELTREAEADAQRLFSQLRTQQPPVYGRMVR